MDNPIDPPILRSRGQAALRARQSLLLSSLRHTLITIRAQLKTITPTTNSNHPYLPPATLSQVLHLSHLIQLLTHLTSLQTIAPIPILTISSTTHPPNTTIAPSQSSTHNPQPNPCNTPNRFQRRTFYRSFPIDERRAPTADWPSIPSTPTQSTPSLSVNLSTDTLHSLDSLPVSPNSPPLPYAHGYAGFRIENPYPSATNNNIMHHVKQDPHISHIQQQRKELQRTKLQFFQPSVEVVNVVRLRDTVFEIGVDGRIRKHTPT